MLPEIDCYTSSQHSSQALFSSYFHPSAQGAKIKNVERRIFGSTQIFSFRCFNSAADEGRVENNVIGEDCLWTRNSHATYTQNYQALYLKWTCKGRTIQKVVILVTYIIIIPSYDKLHCTLQGLAIKTCNRICRWVKAVENDIFLFGGSPFSWWFFQILPTLLFVWIDKICSFPFNKKNMA